MDGQEPPRTLAERLRWARTNAELTTRDLAAHAGVSVGYPSAIECGKLEKPSADALKRLADALGCSFEWLYFGTGKPPSRRRRPATGAA